MLFILINSTKNHDKIYMLFKLSIESKVVLIKRLKSLLWRAGAVLTMMIVDFVARNIGLFDLPVLVNVSIGLVLGEVSKFLNANLQDLKNLKNEE